MEYYLAIRKNEIMPFAATWMDLEIIILSEVRQKKTKKKKNVVYVYNILNHKKNKIMPFTATWVDLEIIILSEVRQ